MNNPTRTQYSTNFIIPLSVEQIRGRRWLYFKTVSGLDDSKERQFIIPTNSNFPFDNFIFGQPYVVVSERIDNDWYYLRAHHVSIVGELRE